MAVKVPLCFRAAVRTAGPRRERVVLTKVQVSKATRHERGSGGGAMSTERMARISCLWRRGRRI